jgi:hypothetical protein
MSSAWRILWWSVRSAPIPITETGVRAGQKRKLGTGVGGLSSNRDTGNAVIVVTILAGDHARQVGVHGCPDNMVSFDANGVETTVVYPELKTYLDYLKSGPWQLRVNKRLFNDPLNKVITTVGVAAGVVTFTCPGLAQMNPGDKFIVAACKGWHAGQFDGTWKVGTHNATTGVITCGTTRRIDPTAVYVPSSGNIRPVDGTQVGFQTIDGYLSNSAHSGTHKVGNAAEGRRGRRSAAH